LCELLEQLSAEAYANQQRKLEKINRTLSSRTL